MVKARCSVQEAMSTQSLNSPVEHSPIQPPSHPPSRRSHKSKVSQDGPPGATPSPSHHFHTPVLGAGIPKSESGDSLAPSLIPNKYFLYENKRRFYVVASDSADIHHRMLKIDRTSELELNIVEDDAIYDARQMADILKMLEDGNRSSGGLSKSQPFFGIAGGNKPFLW